MCRVGRIFFPAYLLCSCPIFQNEQALISTLYSSQNVSSVVTNRLCDNQWDIHLSPLRGGCKWTSNDGAAKTSAQIFSCEERYTSCPLQTSTFFASTDEGPGEYGSLDLWMTSAIIPAESNILYVYDIKIWTPKYVFIP